MLHRCNSRLHSHIRTTHVKLNEKDELYNNECTEQGSKDDVTNEACGEDIKRKKISSGHGVDGRLLFTAAG